MPKRNFAELNDSQAVPLSQLGRVARLQRQQLEGHIENGKKALFQSLKLARGFERQKLGRRQKNAKQGNNETDGRRLEAEVVVLKGLDLAKTAELHLYKTLLKIKSIASAPILPRYIQDIVKASSKQLDAATANVQARLFKSTPVQKVIRKTLHEIRGVLQLNDDRANNNDAPRVKNQTNGLVAKDEHTLHQQKSEQAFRARSGSKADGKDLLGVGEGQQGLDLGDIDDDDRYDLYASRIAASSDGDLSDIESQNSEPIEGALDPESITSEEDSVSSVPDPSLKPLQKPAVTTSGHTQSSVPTKSTTFLPSLSMGGYWSGSEAASDISDDRPQQRKNRRGQRARREIWEKKFGNNAKHLQNQTEDRDKGWDAKRGAREDDGRGKRGRGRGRGGGRGRQKARGGGPVSSGANSDPVGTRKTKPEDSGSLHPSWEAAKRAKEQKATAPFQGKKVLFD
ncbi:hypothetical protein ACLMJK_007712 [Lecanora helva]